MSKLSEDEKDAAVHARAKERGQGTFTIVEQDRSAPATICEWIKQNIETAPDDKLIDALETALKFRKFNPRKNAD